VSAPFKIWAGSKADAPMLAKLHAPIFPDAWPEAAFASLLERPEVVVLLVRRNTSKAAEGFILLRIVGDESEVLTFCVAHDARRGGLGGALLGSASETSRERGAERMFLEVSEINEAALKLYRGAGFSTVGRRAAYYRHGPDAADALVMRKAL
jgi:ribosomal-protein-alanine N-acetyltransferase